jgi:hypothetical protein
MKEVIPMIPKEVVFERAYQAALRNKEAVARCSNPEQAAEIYGRSSELSDLITAMGLDRRIQGMANAPRKKGTREKCMTQYDMHLAR